MTRRILLIGMMGVGKSTVGRLTASTLGWGYLDSDAEVESETGLTVPELFARDGETAFRDAEARALRQACAGTAQVVVSVAGGAVLRPANRRLLSSSGTVVWLRARPETLFDRVGDGAGRPLLEGDRAAVLRELDAVRRPFYAQLADVTIDVDDLAPEQAVSMIIAAAAP